MRSQAPLNGRLSCGLAVQFQLTVYDCVNRAE